MHVSPAPPQVLNRAGGWFDAGLVLLKHPGIMHYMSTRNNNFSNRSQKGLLMVSLPAQVAQVASYRAPV